MFFPRIFALLTVCLTTVIATPASLADTSQTDLPRVRLSTNLGDMILELEQDRAPGTVANFLEYVDAGFYDGTIFHRVIEGFMIQGGGFSENYERKPTRAAIRNEANNGLRNERYSISMARTNAPHSATAQFFINSVDNGNLDHTAPSARGWGYAVFGRVVEGQDVVDTISQVPTGPGGRFSRDAPRDPVVITQASLIVPVDEIVPADESAQQATTASESTSEAKVIAVQPSATTKTLSVQ